jgi:hypothetical protein
VGIFLFSTSRETERGIGEWIASLGWTLNMFGLILFYQYGAGDWESWAYTLPLCVSGENKPWAVRYRAVKAEWEAVERGKILMLIKDMMEVEI